MSLASLMPGKATPLDTATSLAERLAGWKRPRVARSCISRQRRSWKAIESGTIGGGISAARIVAIPLNAKLSHPHLIYHYRFCGFLAAKGSCVQAMGRSTPGRRLAEQAANANGPTTINHLLTIPHPYGMDGRRAVDGRMDRQPTMALEWFTYAALGDRLGISPEAVRQRAIRHEWTKRTGNDGKAEVRVDVEELIAAQLPKSPTERASDDRPSTVPTPVEHAADARMIEALDAHIASLRAMVERAEGQAERERERAIDERARADRERDRADGIAAELARVRSEAAADVASVEKDVATLRRVVEAMRVPAADARAREAALEARIEAVRAEAAALHDRPWWRRMAG